MNTKRCCQCKKEKALSDFGVDKSRKDGVNPRCKSCARDRMKTHRNDHPDLRERERKYAKDYREHHPGYNRKNFALYRANKNNCLGRLSAEEIYACLDFFDHKCAYSGVDLPENYHLDHVVPLISGGSNTIHNIVPCCPKINLSKKDHDFEEWYKNHATFDKGRYEKIHSWIAREG